MTIFTNPLKYLTLLDDYGREKVEWQPIYLPNFFSILTWMWFYLDWKMHSVVKLLALHLHERVGQHCHENILQVNATIESTSFSATEMYLQILSTKPYCVFTIVGTKIVAFITITGVHWIPIMVVNKIQYNLIIIRCSILINILLLNLAHTQLHWQYLIWTLTASIRLFIYFK